MSTRQTGDPGLRPSSSGDAGAGVGRDHEAGVHDHTTSTGRGSRRRSRPARRTSRGHRRGERTWSTAKSSSLTRRGADRRGGRCSTRRRRREPLSRVDVGDRAAGRRRDEADRRPRPARGGAEDARRASPAAGATCSSGLKTLLETGEPLRGLETRDDPRSGRQGPAPAVRMEAPRPVRSPAQSALLAPDVRMRPKLVERGGARRSRSAKPQLADLTSLPAATATGSPGDEARLSS